MRLATIILLFFIFQLNLIAQREDAIVLNIDKIDFSSDTIKLEISVVNNGDRTIALYKPNLKDICWGLLKIYAISENEKSQKHEIFPCEAIIDLESIKLDCDNTVRLSSQEGLKKIFTFPIEDFSPHIKIGKYIFYVELNYSIVNFETNIKDVLNVDLISKGYYYTIEE